MPLCRPKVPDQKRVVMLSSAAKHGCLMGFVLLPRVGQVPEFTVSKSWSSDLSQMSTGDTNSALKEKAQLPLFYNKMWLYF